MKQSCYKELSQLLSILILFFSFSRQKNPNPEKIRTSNTSVLAVKDEFSLSDIERLCPGVSRDMIKKIFADMKKEGLIESLGRGPGATWKKKG